eukprot:3217538-Prymnesium_polylepis.1
MRRSHLVIYSHRLERMPQTSAFAGLVAGEEAVRPAMTCEHRGGSRRWPFLGLCCTVQAAE